MCIPNKQPIEDTKLQDLYEDDSTVNDDTSLNSSVIPEGVVHHIDSVNSDCLDIETDLLGFVYENGSDFLIVYTSPEAQEYCESEEQGVEENPFEQSSIEDSDLEDPFENNYYDYYEENQFENSYLEYPIEQKSEAGPIEEYYWEPEPIEEYYSDEEFSDDSDESLKENIQ